MPVISVGVLERKAFTAEIAEGSRRRALAKRPGFAPSAALRAGSGRTAEAAVAT